MSAEIIYLHTNTFNTPVTNASIETSSDAEKELLDYMIWTMKHEMDPHKLYDDPIEVFRNEYNGQTTLVC